MIRSLVEKGHRVWQRARRASGHRLLPAMATVASLTLLVKVVSAAKEMQVARSLGVGDSLDALYIAFLLPSIIINVIGGSLNAALIPTFIRVRENDGPGPAYRLYSSVTVCSLAFLILLGCLLAALFPAIAPVIGASFGAAKLACTRSLFLILIPVIALTGISTTWGAILNASERFALVAITPMITPLAALISLLLLGHSYGVYALAGATLAGATIEAVVLGIGLLRLGMPLGFRWFGLSTELKHVLQQYAPVAAGALIFSGTSFADQTLAARIGSGAVASLAYGNKIVSLVVGIGATGVGASVLPYFSSLVAARDLAGLRSALRLSTIVVLAAALPIAGVLCVGSTSIIRLVFQHGAFNVADTRIVSHVQACYALGIPVYVVGGLYLKLVSALSMNSRILIIACFNVVLNFVLDLLFMRVFGVAGIALSTTFVSLSSCILLYLLLRRPLQESTEGGPLLADRCRAEIGVDPAPSDVAA